MQIHDPKMTKSEISGGPRDPAWFFYGSSSADARRLTIGEMAILGDGRGWSAFAQQQSALCRIVNSRATLAVDEIHTLPMPIRRALGRRENSRAPGFRVYSS